MKCSIKGCLGVYEPKKIVHTIQHKGEIIVFENVPAEVCSICGDTLLTPETVKELEILLQKKNKPERLIPLYEYV